MLGFRAIISEPPGGAFGGRAVAWVLCEVAALAVAIPAMLAAAASPATAMAVFFLRFTQSPPGVRGALGTFIRESRKKKP
jgi:hypothetical protein